MILQRISELIQGSSACFAPVNIGECLELNDLMFLGVVVKGSETWVAEECYRFCQQRATHHLPTIIEAKDKLLGARLQPVQNTSSLVYRVHLVGIIRGDVSRAAAAHETLDVRAPGDERKGGGGRVARVQEAEVGAHERVLALARVHEHVGKSEAHAQLLELRVLHRAALPLIARMTTTSLPHRRRRRRRRARR